MNILFFLKPKNETVYIQDTSTIRQALEKMEHHRYTSVPVINNEGEYVGTISEGDVLWEIKNRYNFDLKEAEKLPIGTVKRNRDNLPVDINSDMSDLIAKSISQNFIPVIDDRKKFIGIVTRTDIIKYFLENNIKK